MVSYRWTKYPSNTDEYIDTKHNTVHVLSFILFATNNGLSSGNIVPVLVSTMTDTSRSQVIYSSSNKETYIVALRTSRFEFTIP